MPSFDHLPTCFVGCDVSKAEIAVFDSADRRTTTIANDAAALTRFADALDPGCLVVCEVTGGFEAELLLALTRAGRAVHRADPRRVKAFIRSLGTLGKTDAIDARALARYGQERHLDLARWQPAEAAADRLHSLVMTRRDLVAARTAFANRAGAPAAAASAFVAPVLAAIEAQLARLEAEIAGVIAASAALSQRAARLAAIPGIGATTAAALLALMPELGQLGRRQAAALAGLAPHPHQSGLRDGYRRTRGGRPEVKRTLFMAAMSAAKHHPQLAPFYRRLIARGKKPIVALVAVMRKLIVLCNAVLRDAAV